MRSGAAAHHTGYFHETCFYGSDDELMEVVVPFLRDGVEGGEPTIVTFGARNAELTRAALGDTEGITFVPGELRYARPAASIREYRSMFDRLTRAGATQIRVVGDVPHPGTGASWDTWRRYEAVINHGYDAWPVWGICPYDTRITPDDVLEDVAATHAHIASADGHHANPGFRDPESLLRAVAAPPAPLEAPSEVLADVDPATARATTARAARAAGLTSDDAAALALAVTELVSNGARHGVPPVQFELWIEPGRVRFAVTDAGPGIRDPWAGLIGPEDLRGAGGRGLWLVHQLCDDVVIAGSTVRGAVGRR